MPFQSEKQRRYLWANEPEIARDWADTYGSRIKKSNGGITQAGVTNYLPSKMVDVPVEAKSSPEHVKAHLAYITDKEQDLLLKKNLFTFDILLLEMMEHYLQVELKLKVS